MTSTGSSEEKNQDAIGEHQEVVSPQQSDPQPKESIGTEGGPQPKQSAETGKSPQPEESDKTVGGPQPEDSAEIIEVTLPHESTKTPGGPQHKETAKTVGNPETPQESEDHGKHRGSHEARRFKGQTCRHYFSR